MSKLPAVPEAMSPEAKRLMQQAHGGSYAVWLRVSPIRSNTRPAGAAVIRRDFQAGALGRIAVEGGQPGYAVASSRGSQPCLYIRARTRAGFTQLALGVHRLAGAMGYELIVLDATEQAYSAIQSGLTR